jgi:putative Holliday junction resolvase
MSACASWVWTSASKRIGLARPMRAGFWHDRGRRSRQARHRGPRRPLVAAIIRDAGADDPVERGRVGLPRRLTGEDTDQTAPTRQFAAALADLAGVRVHLQDERLTSVEAESRLAVHERDWRKRKAKIDATAAAIIPAGLP